MTHPLPNLTSQPYHCPASFRREEGLFVPFNCQTAARKVSGDMRHPSAPAHPATLAGVDVFTIGEFENCLAFIYDTMPEPIKAGQLPMNLLKVGPVRQAEGELALLDGRTLPFADKTILVEVDWAPCRKEQVVLYATVRTFLPPDTLEFAEFRNSLQPQVLVHATYLGGAAFELTHDLHAYKYGIVRETGKSFPISYEHVLDDQDHRVWVNGLVANLPLLLI